MSEWIIHTDGASRANPGPAAFAYLIERSGQPDIEESGYLGTTTNNIAEYTALLKALEHAKELGGKRLVVQTDSELMVKQMQGAYKVRNEGLLPLYQQAKKLAAAFESVTLKHIRREFNKRADALCNEALDEAKLNPGASLFLTKAGRKPAPPEPPAVEPVTAPKTSSKVHDRAIECLRTAAAAWARGNIGDPRPDEVWRWLCNILKEEGLLK